MTTKRQADDETHEDQLLNFLVNTSIGAFSLNLGENAEIDPDDLYLFALREQRRRSFWHRRSPLPPHKFDFDTVASVGNLLLQRDVIEHLSEQVEIVVDLHLRPYYGNEDETSGLYHCGAKDETTAFHAYPTLYVRMRNKQLHAGGIVVFSHSEKY